ncbi:uncharacterized protein METZ01_LOCUS198012, partial [marine metagenome]
MSFYERVSGVRLRRWIEQESGELGFDLFGVAAVDPSAHLDFYRAWIKDGAQGEMAYLARTDAIARRGDLRRTLPSARSAIVVGHEYYQEDPLGV